MGLASETRDGSSLLEYMVTKDSPGCITRSGIIIITITRSGKFACSVPFPQRQSPKMAERRHVSLDLVYRFSYTL